MGQLKTQIMTMFMMKSASTPQGKQGSGGNEIFSILYSMIMLSMVEWAFKQAPAAFLAIKTYLMTRYAPKKPVWMPLADKSKKEVEQLNSVTLTRIFKEATGVGGSAKDIDRADNVYVEKVDAVLDYICNIDNARHVRMDVRCSLNNVEEIELMPLLKARVKQTSGNELNTVELVLFSSVLKISDIRNWIDEIHSNYVAEKNNKLGNKIYYFNEVPAEPVVMTDMTGPTPKKTYRWDNMPKSLAFNMSEFKTSKSFNNVYGDHVNELKERLDLFVNHPDWYMERGIPHSLGIMLHGVPGAGKTSTIKAIAKDTNRHIFNLSLRPYTTQRQLTNLFFNESVTVHTYDGGKQSLKIPLNRRVYVIEDIDCLTDVVLDRQLKSAAQDKEQQQDQQPTEGDAVTLSFLLNLLDGVLETPGRILVITSNYPEKLDKALVRPGRIDVKINFKNATRAFILDMINKFYKITMTLDEIPAELEDIFTPAEVMESLCYYFKSPSQALIHLVQKHQSKKLLEVQSTKASMNVDQGHEQLSESFKSSADAPKITICELPSYIIPEDVLAVKKQSDKCIKAFDQTFPDHPSRMNVENDHPYQTDPELVALKKASEKHMFSNENIKRIKANVDGTSGNFLKEFHVQAFCGVADEPLEGGFASAMFESDVPPEGAGGNTNFEWDAKRHNPKMINLNEA